MNKYEIKIYILNYSRKVDEEKWTIIAPFFLLSILTAPGLIFSNFWSCSSLYKAVKEIRPTGMAVQVAIIKLCRTNFEEKKNED